MAKIIDLDVMVQEPVQFIIGGETYEIPGNPSTDFLIKFMAMDQKRLNKKDPTAQVEVVADMVVALLGQDLNHQVNKEFVMKKLSFTQMMRIVEVFKDTVQETEQNPN